MCSALLAILPALAPALAHPGEPAYAPPPSTAQVGDLYALEFGEPDPDPEHADPEEQQVLEDPADWPWWAWVIVLFVAVAIGVPLAIFLMRRAARTRSPSGRELD